MKYWAFIITFLASATNAWASSDESADIGARELKCLAMNIYHEARGEPIEGQLAVAMVTMNRVYSGTYPDTVCKVVWQRRQFSWTHDGKPDRPEDVRSWKLAKKIADFVYNKYQVYSGLSGGAMDLTKGALYYYAPKLVNPHWANHKEKTTEIGNHVFMRTKTEDNS